MTMIIAVPTGVKIFNWLFTMYGGRVRFTVPVLWSIGFMVTFVIGGMTGVLMAVPPADFQLHNSLFLVAHFHNVIIGGVVFGVMAGYNYWFPKAFGFKLDERWGKAAFWCWLIGFYLAFMPLYVLGLMGMTRRMQHYDVAQLAAVAVGGGGRRRHHSGGDRLPGRAARRVDPRPRTASRRDRRSVERPHAGMVNRLAAAGLELRGPAAVSLRATPSGSGSNARARNASSAGASAQVRADRDAEEQPDRLRHRLLCRRHRLCPDLAHLVDGRCSDCSAHSSTLLAFAFRERRKSRYRPSRLLEFDQAHQAEVAL